MIRLLRYLKEYRRESIFGPLLKMLEALMELFVPLIISAMIDRGIRGGGGRGYLISRCLLLILLGLLGLACSVTAQYLAARAAVGFTKRVREALFGKIQRLSYQDLDTLGTSTLLTRMTSDMNQVQNGLNLTLRLLLRSPFVVFGSMIMAFTIDVRLALIFTVVIPILAVIVFAVMLSCIPLYKRVQTKLDRVMGAVRENLTGVRVVRAFVREEEEQRAFKEKHGELTREQVITGRISALLNPLTYVVLNLAIVMLIYRGAIRVETGVLTLGALVALYNYMAQILTELIKLANLIINITRAFACGNRVQAILDTELSQQEGTEQTFDFTAPAVAFDDVSLVYGDNREPSAEHLTFSVKAGETVGIIGGTGDGKTTLVNLIPRFYDASSGTVRVFGRDVKTCDTHTLRALIGVVPQKAALFRGSIRENLLWGNENAAEDDLLAACRAAQAEDILAQKGLDGPVEQGGRNFSGGQRQRLTIARALVRKPKILILDDASSALDYATDARLRQAIRELNDTTVFLVSQRTTSIMNADRILVMDDGRIVAQGTHETLLKTCAAYREIHESVSGGAGV